MAAVLLRPRQLPMPLHRSTTPKRRILYAAALLAALMLLALWTLALASARGASIDQLQQQISAGRGEASSLSAALSAASGRLSQIDASISSLEARISRIQADLDAKRARLISLEEKLNAARTRLVQLEAFEARAESVLSQQLVNSYESDRPDLVSVVLASSGFQDLLERIAFENRIQKQNTQVAIGVRRARRSVAAQAVLLGSLELRQQKLTTAVLHERDGLAAVRVSLLRQRVAAAEIRDRRAGQLQAAQSHLSDLQQQLSQAQQAQAAQASQGSAPSGSAPVASGSPAGSSGGFTFPLPKDAASPPGTWSPDQGVDISAPGDTPEFAVCSGTIVLHGIGGFGPDAPVLHCDSPLDGYDYVYYGHAGPVNQLPVGTHVSAGQAMSSVGPGIVGISTGPHLEIGFCDASGSPIGPQTAGTMLSLLQASY